MLKSIFFGFKWQQYQKENRFLDYFDKYETFVYVLTTLAGFYNTIDLCQCKLFYLKIFHLQLNFKFFNIVILENIPQLFMQLYFLIYFSNNNNIMIVFISMVCSILSIILSSLSQIDRICQKLWKKSFV